MDAGWFPATAISRACSTPQTVYSVYFVICNSLESSCCCRPFRSLGLAHARVASTCSMLHPSAPVCLHEAFSVFGEMLGSQCDLLGSHVIMPVESLAKAGRSLYIRGFAEGKTSNPEPFLVCIVSSSRWTTCRTVSTMQRCRTSILVHAMLRRPNYQVFEFRLAGLCQHNLRQSHGSLLC